jgi:crotonobetainyl-CoA:carnitine CoA-transferase CaiB-like acyl-CoA transferase
VVVFGLPLSEDILAAATIRPVGWVGQGGHALTVPDAGLLAALRVLDMSGGDGDAVSRILADLGADVVKVEPLGGSPGRTALPRLAGTSIAFALHNANKRSVTLDPASDADRRRLLDLVSEADILIDAGRPGFVADFGTSCADLAARFEHLVALSVTDFGQSGPRASWRGTDAVFYALSSALSRSGPPTGTPVLPPDGIASATAAVQATWAALVAFYHRLRCGRGDYIDFSRYDATVLALDPPFGSMGQAASARGVEKWRGRPRNQDSYPIIGCQDGHVRLVVMAPRQWHGLRAWLGEPAEFADRKYDAIGERFAAWDRIGALLTQLFADQTMDELVAIGQSYGVPIAAVLEPSEVAGAEHFAATGAFADIELMPGVHTSVPVGYFTVDGQRRGFHTPAPEFDTESATWRPAPRPVPATGQPGMPFAGLRIVDLGIIVAGGELSRLFGDLGAEVIKVESAQFPDGLRQTQPGQQMNASFAWTHRNNRSLGLELRTTAGTQVFTELIGSADAVFANFKPGTLAGLGFPYERLRELNPGIVLAESSAFGETGPWSTHMGYGPLVRATTGVTSLWTADSAAPNGGRHRFYDATTVFPDHVVGRIAAIGALAGLIRRERTATGTRIHISQAEAGINQLDTMFVERSAGEQHPDLLTPAVAENAVYPCLGEDEWCVISLVTDADRSAAEAVMGKHSGWADWILARTPLEAADQLQGAGVAAAPMQRRADVLADPQLIARQLYRPMTHPLFEEPLPAESGPAPYLNVGPALTAPAPLAGRDTREICRDVLGFDDARIDRLLTDGVLFTASERAPT